MLRGSSALGFAYMDEGYPFGWVFVQDAIIAGMESPIVARLVPRRVLVATVRDGYSPGARLEA